MVMKYIYVIRGGEDCYKVGVADNVQKRLRGLQTSNAAKLQLVAARLVRNPVLVERALHVQLMKERCNGGTEWFRLDTGKVVDLLVTLHEHPDAVYLENLRVEQLLEEVTHLFKQIDKKIDSMKKSPDDEDPTVDTIVTAAKGYVKRAVADEALFESALAAFRKEKRVSVSLLQRKLGIGYGRASRIMDKLLERGAVNRADVGQYEAKHAIG